MQAKFYQMVQQIFFRISKKWFRSSYLELLLVCFIVGIIVWGYYETLNDFFILEDFQKIQESSRFGQFWKHLLCGSGGKLYHPLGDLLFIWDFYWWKWNPFGWHLTNLIVHIINVLLVYDLVKHLTKNSYAGIITGGLFGLFPGNSEAVIWISARTDLLCTTFFLLSLRCFMALSESKEHDPNIKEHHQKRLYVMSLVFFVGALITKEIAVTLPFIVLLYDLIFSTRWKSINIQLWKKVKIYMPYFCILAAYCTLRLLVLYMPGEDNTSLFGTFILDNVVWYFKMLTLPFGEHIFSSSVVINIAGIVFVAMICLFLSKESCFAMLWICATLVPVSFLRVQREVYLASVGFCILIAMILTYSTYRSVSTKKNVRKTIRTLQIVLIVALLYRYSTARKEANAWWSGVAEIHVKVPLLVQSLYPDFPKDSRMCLQNVPFVFNQDLNGAFLFRYPDNQFEGIYVKDFEECAQDETAELSGRTYFFHYDKGDVYDFTYEMKEKMADQQPIYIERLFLSPHHKLLKETPQLHLEFDEVSPFSAIGIVTSLAGGIEVLQGTVVARGQLEGEHGVVETFEIVAGQDTAEWAIRFPYIQKIVKHAMPQVYRAWTVQQPDETVDVAQNYIKQINFQTPFVLTKFFLEFIPSSDIPSELMLDVDRIVFYGDKRMKP